MKTIILFSSANKNGNTAKTVDKVHADHQCEVIHIDELDITPEVATDMITSTPMTIFITYFTESVTLTISSLLPRYIGMP